MDKGVTAVNKRIQRILSKIGTLNWKLGCCSIKNSYFLFQISEKNLGVWRKELHYKPHAVYHFVNVDSLHFLQHWHWCRTFAEKRSMLCLTFWKNKPTFTFLYSIVYCNLGRYIRPNWKHRKLIFFWPNYLFQFNSIIEVTSNRS